VLTAGGWAGPPRGSEQVQAGTEQPTVRFVGDNNTATRAVVLKPLLSA